MATIHHVGGKKHTCPACERSCLFYTAKRNLTRYALLCGYVEFKRGKNLSMEHNTFHVKGTNAQGNRVWESFDLVTQARRYLSQP